MKILLFGGSGMVGRELSQVLSGHTVVAPQHAEIDIVDSEAIQRLMTDEKPDFVINAAALINVDAIEENPEPAWQINTHAAGYIAQAAARALIPVMYISTNYVFGDDKLSYTEEDLTAPVNTYGETKAAGEALIAQYCGDTGTPYYIVRTSWLYSTTRDTVVDFFAKTLLSGEVVDASSGLGNPTFAGDLAVAIEKNFIEGKQESGIYHLINESADSRGGVSRFDVACAVAQILGVPPSKVREVSDTTWFKAPRPKAALLQNIKLPPLQHWQTALSAYILSKYVQEKNS